MGRVIPSRRLTTDCLLLRRIIDLRRSALLLLPCHVLHPIVDCVVLSAALILNSSSSSLHEKANYQASHHVGTRHDKPWHHRRRMQTRTSSRRYRRRREGACLRTTLGLRMKGQVEYMVRTNNLKAQLFRPHILFPRYRCTTVRFAKCLPPPPSSHSVSTRCSSVYDNRPDGSNLRGQTQNQTFFSLACSFGR